jgi:hypothetical protein
MKRVDAINSWRGIPGEGGDALLRTGLGRLHRCKKETGGSDGREEENVVGEGSRDRYLMSEM